MSKAEIISLATISSENGSRQVKTTYVLPPAGRTSTTDRLALTALPDLSYKMATTLMSGISKRDLFWGFADRTGEVFSFNKLISETEILSASNLFSSTLSQSGSLVNSRVV